MKTSNAQGHKEYSYILIIRLYTNFELTIYTGAGRKVCGGGGGWWWWWWEVVECDFSFLVRSKYFCLTFALDLNRVEQY